jgi:hypothetical protein
MPERHSVNDRNTELSQAIEQDGRGPWDIVIIRVRTTINGSNGDSRHAPEDIGEQQL